MNLRELFKIMVAKEASDMFLSTETVPRARINGSVKSSVRIISPKK